jgi:probable phosphoglycerate mutase
LHCAATLLLARHAEAEYEDELVADRGGSLTVTGRRQARVLGESLAGRRVAWVYTSPMARAVQTAEIAAGVLGLHVSVREGLREFAVGDHAGRPFRENMFAASYDAWLAGDEQARVPGGESGAEVLARMAAELAGIADLHPGETVLVVSHGGVLGYAVPHLAVNLPGGFAGEWPLGYADLVEAAADADGMVVRGWAGRGLADPSEVTSG